MGAALNIYPAENGSLIEITEQYMQDKNLTIKEMADRIELSRSTLSRYLSGSYPNPTSIERSLKDYYSAMGMILDTSPSLPKKNEFYQSADARRITAVCSSCQEFIGLGIIVGNSGYGKTHALKYYARLPKVAYIECDDTMASRDLVEAIERMLGIHQTYGTIWRRVNGIRTFLNQNPGYLIIIDEADKLLTKYTQKKMEILRGIVDQSRVGMVIAGEPRLEALIKSYLPRLANRVDFYYDLRGLDKQEVEQYLAAFPLADEALGELVHRACNTKNGCFRLLDRTLSNVLRLMGESRGTQITLQMIEQASDMMML